MSPQRTRQAFSLAEILVLLMLMGIAIVALNQAAVGMKSNRAHVRAEAEQLAELLRSLRQQAITQGRPVGLGIPSAGQSKAASAGYYLLEGEVRPKVVRTVTLGRERSVQLAGACWSEVPFVAGNPTSFTDSSYTLSNWQAPYPQDGLLMFLPTGEVLTNLPTYQGEVALVLGYALEGQWSTLSGRPAVRLDQAKGPMVVWCSLLGDVRQEAGLASAPHRTVAALVGSPSAALPPITPTSGNSAPVFISLPPLATPLQISPPPNPNTLGTVSPGNTGTLRLKRYVSLKVSARDPDGDALFCHWTSVGNLGRFTKEGEVQMRYDPSQDAWIGTWAWHAPAGAAASDVFELHAEVVDKRGGVATLNGSISGGGKFQILTPGRLAFTRGQDTWMSNWDGSDPVIVARGLSRPRWSRDGETLCCLNSTSLNTQLWVVAPDGRAQQKLLDRAGTYLSQGSFSPSGSRIAFVQDTGTGPVIYQVPTWGGAVQPWSSADMSVLATAFPAGTEPVVDCHQDNENVMISGNNAAGPVYLVNSTTVTLLPGVVGAEASFSDDCSQVIYRSATGQIARSPFVTSGPWAPSATLDLGGARHPHLSKNGNYAVVQGDSGGQSNCFLIYGGLSLTQPLKLFDFAEPCGDPDWAD